jgi:type I restriction enzyme S subunit
VILTAGKTLSDAGFAISRHIPAGATLFVCIGSTIGKIGIAGQNLATNQQINALVAGNELDARYLYWAVTTLSKMVREQAGEQAVPLVSKSHFGGFEIAVPTLSEQREIAEAIDDADDFVESIERLIAKMRNIKQGMMQELLTGRTRLQGFTGEWTFKKIGDFAEVKAGGTPSTAIPRYWGGDIRWMSSGEIHRKRVQEVEGRISFDGLRESAAQLLPIGTVLMALAGQGKTRGTVAVSRVELSTNQSIAGILPSTKHVPDFLYYNLDTRYDELRGESAGDGGRGGLNLAIIKRLTVFMPPLNEQVAIAQVLGDADDEIDALERGLESARAIKTGMMQELLSGRTRLPVEEVVA